MEYEVHWGDGPLGLTLRPDLGEDMPPVVGRITRLDSAAALAKVAVGHMLVSINGVDTARQGYDHVVDLLQKISRPATLRFRVPRAVTPSGLTSMASSGSLSGGGGSSRDSRERRTRTSIDSEGSQRSSRRREQYTIVWTEGPLGMILRPDDDDCHVPCIRKITGKGAGTGMERASVGDILVAVNGQETKALGFRNTIALLKTIRKPAVLKFKKMRRRLSRRRSSQEASETGAPSMTVPTGGSGSISMPYNGGGVPSSRDQGVYDIVWREGELGLKLKPGYMDVPVISRLTGKGTAGGLHNANVGDELVSVNGSLVEGETYQDTLRVLKHSPKPAVLRFRPGRDRHQPSLAHLGRSTSSVRDGSRSTDPYGQPSSERSRSRTRRDREKSGERKKTRRRIPLDVAKELVAASLGTDVQHGSFAGVRIKDIADGTREAHLLRVEAKACITNQAEKNRSGGVVLPTKEALTRAEKEAQVLAEALERVKSQAKKYEQILKGEEKTKILAPAMQNKTKDIIGKQNNVIAELAGVISGFKRDSYSELEVIPLVLEDPKDKAVGGVAAGQETVVTTAVTVPTGNYCAECGATEHESKLEKDDDGEFYCTDCWENFLNGPSTAAVTSPPAPALSPVPAPTAVTPAVGTPERTLERSSSSAFTPSKAERELEEQQARIEAEKKLMELKQLRRSGSMTSERPNNLSSVDRTKRDKEGLDEFARALKEEEERARADGNMELANRLAAQRARTLVQASGDLQMKREKSLSVDEVSETEFGHYYDNGTSTGTSGAGEALNSSVMERPSLRRSVTSSAVLEASSATKPSPKGMIPLFQNPSTTAATPTTPNDSESVPMASATSAPVSSETTTTSNDYADVNSDDEAGDRVSTPDEEKVLRAVEEKNFALARQLEEAHNVVERARLSILESGDDEEDDSTGLSQEQISLFKKLKSEAEERQSFVDSYQVDEDSDSDSDDASAVSGGDDEEEGDDGVWI